MRPDYPAPRDRNIDLGGLTMSGEFALAEQERRHRATRCSLIHKRRNRFDYRVLTYSW